MRVIHPSRPSSDARWRGADPETGLKVRLLAWGTSRVGSARDGGRRAGARPQNVDVPDNTDPAFIIFVGRRRKGVYYKETHGTRRTLHANLAYGVQL